MSLYIHLVRPHLDYACEVWSPHQAYLIDILEGAQRRATKVVVKNKPYCERLKELKLLSLVSRRKYFDLIFPFKCRLGLCDINLSDFLKSAINASYDLRKVECSYKIKYAKTKTLKFSYFHRVVKEWNDLPLSLRKIDSIKGPFIIYTSGGTEEKLKKVYIKKSPNRPRCSKFFYPTSGNSRF